MKCNNYPISDIAPFINAFKCPIQLNSAHAALDRMLNSTGSDSEEVIEALDKLIEVAQEQRAAA